MSYDFELYTNRSVKISQPEISAGSNVAINGPYLCDDDDIDENLLSLIGKKRYLTQVHLEGDVLERHQSIIDVWLREIITETKGILFDPQTNEYEGSTKSGWLGTVPPKPIPLGHMNFYFQGGEEFYNTGFEALLMELSNTMPEATPKRFGHFEPLQHRIENFDFSGLIENFKSATDIIMKTDTPFGHIYMSTPCKKTFERWHPKHFNRRLFMLNHLSFELRPQLFSNPAKHQKFIALFKKLCVSLNIVYAEILTGDSQGGWFWFGLPNHQTHTMCVGPEYQSVWPQIAEHGEPLNDDIRIISSNRFGSKPPMPPNELLAPSQHNINPGSKPNYASVFPFDYVFDYDTYVW